MAASTLTGDRLEALEAKIDLISDRVLLLTEAVELDRDRRRRWEDLSAELGPIASEAFEVVARELDEVRDFVEPADMLRFAKRLARDLPYLEALLDQVESMTGLAADVGPLSGAMFETLMGRLDDLEQRGYFAFARGLWAVSERVITSFSEDDLQQLGDNIVLILNTVKEMTQPEVMRMLQRTAAEVRSAEVEEIGLLKMMWRMRSPAVRRGMSRMLKVLESLADAEEPASIGEVGEAASEASSTHNHNDPGRS